MSWGLSLEERGKGASLPMFAWHAGRVLRECLLVLEATLMERVGGRQVECEWLCGLLEMGKRGKYDAA